MSLSPVDSRLFFVRPDYVQTALLSNQSSGLINAPETGKPVPSTEAKALIMTNHNHISDVTAYVEGVTAKADAEKALTARLAAYARAPNEERRGRLLDVRA